MRASILARKFHKWLALIIGVQALLWMLTGVYMVTINIDFIHGDSLVRNLNEPLSADSSDLYSVSDVLRRYPESLSVSLETSRGVPLFVVTRSGDTVLLDARSGQQMAPVTHDQAVELASHYYAGSGSVSEAVLLIDASSIPQEIRGRSLPLWQVTFEDRFNTTFYLSPSTGNLLTRRHTYWRLYDFLWMFHIMDYENRSDINNKLLGFAAAFGLAMALSGIWLLVHSLRGRQNSGAELTAQIDQPGRTYGPVSKTS